MGESNPPTPCVADGHCWPSLAGQFPSICHTLPPKAEPSLVFSGPAKVRSPRSAKAERGFATNLCGRLAGARDWAGEDCEERRARWTVDCRLSTSSEHLHPTDSPTSIHPSIRHVPPHCARSVWPARARAPAGPALTSVFSIQSSTRCVEPSTGVHRPPSTVHHHSCRKPG
jgi:hypothetical protein